MTTDPQNYLPIPLRLTFWGVFDALSLIVRVPLIEPFFNGLTLTAIEHFPPTESVVQLFVWL